MCLDLGPQRPDLLRQRNPAIGDGACHRFFELSPFADPGRLLRDVICRSRTRIFQNVGQIIANRPLRRGEAETLDQGINDTVKGVDDFGHNFGVDSAGHRAGTTCPAFFDPSV